MGKEKQTFCVATIKVYPVPKTCSSFLLTSIIAMGLSSTATAFCIEPSAPGYRPDKPSVPWCVNEFAGTHTCDEWEINDYYAAIDRYRSEVSDYVNQLNLYIDEAVAYAQCEVANLE